MLAGGPQSRNDDHVMKSKRTRSAIFADSRISENSRFLGVWLLMVPITVSSGV